MSSGSTPRRPSLGAEIEGSLVVVRYVPAPGSPERVVSGELLRVANLGPVGFLVVQTGAGLRLIRLACVNLVEIAAESEVRSTGT